MAVAPKMQSSPSSRPGSTSRLGLGDVFRSLNYPLLVVALIVIGYGLLVVWSATSESSDYSFNRQLMGVGVGLVLMLVLWRVDYSRLSAFTSVLFGLCIILMLMPLLPVIGVTINGARSWITIFGQQIQPGEIAKICYILFAASLIARYKGRLDSGLEYLKCFALLMVPILCIMLQPDLGTGMVLFVIGMVALFAGGANRRWLIATVVVIVALAILALTLDGLLDTAFGSDVLLKDYQKNRLLVFLDSSLDPGGAGYNLKQAQIAIGSGGLSGKGLGNATQSALGFLPEAPTDFIFCVLAEEFGFLGSLLLIVLYAALLFLVLRVAFTSYDLYGTLVVTGILGMWIFQILENIGMTCGLMPITGIPLPFMSYGSSFMLVNFMSLGLILSVWAHRNPVKSAVSQSARRVQ
ncbi:MAG: rod shape-determining protein RodA [Coriobacteriales bacterium]|jgi:rod shape determining protein RodA|nr:rod shape-determining protein RodA [Coriobacteriales bacterium]